MSFVLFVEPIMFGADPRIQDNKFIVAAEVSEAEAQKDQRLAEELLRDQRTRISRHGVQAMVLRLRDEPNPHAQYGSKGDAIFPNNSISFHNFTDAEGKITRRLVILYPMSTYRRGELPKAQLIDKLEAAAEEGLIELVDLRGFEEAGRCLEGTGALNFSADGRYVYMSRSGRTDDEVLDIVCAPENLNIPPERRFVFSSSIPSSRRAEEDVIYHTNIVGWCGRGVCAWGLEFMHFDSDAGAERFYNHLEQAYQLVLQLNEEEVKGFAGNSIEHILNYEDGTEVHVLCMSETAERALQEEHYQALAEWYGGRENLLSFYGEVLERRTGGSIRCTQAASVTHGDTVPAEGEKTILEVCGIKEKS